MTVGSARPSIYWTGLLVATVVALVAFDAILLHMGSGFFSGGFQSIYVESRADVFRYFAGAALLDLALVAASWTLFYPVLLRFARGPLGRGSLAAVLAAAPAALHGLAFYRIHQILGKMVSTSLLNTGSIGSSTTSAAVIADFLPPVEAMIIVVLLLGITTVPIVARSIDSKLKSDPAPLPRWRALFLLSLVAILASFGVFKYSISRDPTLYFGLSRKTSGQWLAEASRFATDWDRDGYGYTTQPVDMAPFDASIHPYAIEIAGNGIDENGLAGDQPTGFVPHPRNPVGHESTGTRPNLLLIFLESFRWDLLEAEADGRPITPFLSELGSDGSRSDEMYVHSPWTLVSRDQLFRGRIPTTTDSSTIIDDFKSRGYRVACFSGQDDSYGRSDERLGCLRADHFYDARQDLDRRTTRSVLPVSLQVSWKTLLERVFAYLSEVPEDKPLFLYVNIVDTHFPYAHSQLDEIIADTELERSEIRPGNRDRVFRAYKNTAANVDRAAARLVGEWRRKFGDRETAIVVTGDHGESFYESGTLGHGQTVAAVETRVPLLVRGIGGDWPEPIAISELRHLIVSNIGRNDGETHPRFRPDPSKWIFQFLGPLDKPEQIARRDLAGVDIVDLLSGRTSGLDALERPIEQEPDRERITHLIWTWERLQEIQIRARPPTSN